MTCKNDLVWSNCCFPLLSVCEMGRPCASVISSPSSKSNFKVVAYSANMMPIRLLSTRIFSATWIHRWQKN
uniref:Secreted protein n=1 Tax=Ditylenchus dipsaci TaxID=166011 RepID=A0A915DWF5_9BILA